MKKIAFLAAAIGMIVVAGCSGCSKSGKRQISPRKSDSSSIIIPNPANDIDPGFSIAVGGVGLDSFPGETVGKPVAVTYLMDLHSWNMVVEKPGNDCRIKIDSATASALMNDRSILYVKVAGKKVTLLRE